MDNSRPSPISVRSILRSVLRDISLDPAITIICLGLFPVLWMLVPRPLVEVVHNETLPYDTPLASILSAFAERVFDTIWWSLIGGGQVLLALTIVRRGPPAWTLLVRGMRWPPRFLIGVLVVVLPVRAIESAHRDNAAPWLQLAELSLLVLAIFYVLRMSLVPIVLMETELSLRDALKRGR